MGPPPQLPRCGAAGLPCGERVLHRGGGGGGLLEGSGTLRSQRFGVCVLL